MKEGEKPKLKIEHFSEKYKGGKNDDESYNPENIESKPVEIINALLEGEMDFVDGEERQEKLEKLRKMYKEIVDKKEKTKEDLEKLAEIEAAARGLLNQ